MIDWSKARKRTAPAARKHRGDYDDDDAFMPMLAMTIQVEQEDRMLIEATGVLDANGRMIFRFFEPNPPIGFLPAAERNFDFDPDAYVYGLSRNHCGDPRYFPDHTQDWLPLSGDEEEAEQEDAEQEDADDGAEE